VQASKLLLLVQNVDVTHATWLGLFLRKNENIYGLNFSEVFDDPSLYELVTTFREQCNNFKI